MENNVVIKNNNTPSIDKIKYKGIVTVTLKKRNRIISKKTFHNQGGIELFKFLCKSLDRSADAEQYRPIKIKLFYNASNTPTDTSGELYSLCDCITANEIRAVYDKLPGKESSEEDKTWYTTLHFTIPNSSINTTEHSEVREIRLYSASVNVDSDKTDYGKYCADFKFTNEDGTAWNGVVVNSSKNSYNLIISWSLSFTN